MAATTPRPTARRAGAGRQDDPDHISLLTLAQHEAGAPQAVAVYDQKENPARCEQTAAAALLEKLPALKGQLLTAAPLHCPRGHARIIVEKAATIAFRSKATSPSCWPRRKPSTR